MYTALVSSDERYTLTRRDQEIIEALTLRVRLFSLRQLARTWWAGSAAGEPQARARMKLLERAGLVTGCTLMARPELELAAPVIAWEPGAAEPDFGAASWQLCSRFTAPLRHTPCIIATPQAGVRYGGRGGRFPKAAEQTHDLHVATLFLRYRERHPELVPNWLSEELIKRSRPQIRGEKLPDALIRTESFTRVVEFGGEYARGKLEAFHGYCRTRSLPYEVW